MRKFTIFSLFALSILQPTSGFGQAPLTAAVINAAEFSESLPEGVSAVTTKLQVLLDRAGSNPGVIDGVAGENVQRQFGAMKNYWDFYPRA